MFILQTTVPGAGAPTVTPPPGPPAGGDDPALDALGDALKTQPRPTPPPSTTTTGPGLDDLGAALDGDRYVRSDGSTYDGGGPSILRPAVQIGAIPGVIYYARYSGHVSTLLNGGEVTSTALSARHARLALDAERAARALRVAKTAQEVNSARQALSTAGYASRAARIGAVGVGRWLPILGAGLAVLDCGADLYNLGTMERQAGESEEDFQKRLSTARSDAAINIGCTATGAVIGGIIGSCIPVVGTFIGACIGAGIGNLIGGAFKSDGWGRKLCRGIGRLLFG